MIASSAPPRLSGHFVDGRAGSLFVSLWRPTTPAAKLPCVMFVPPFGDEMNKSRHMFAAVARSLADQGMAAVAPDLYGTGDSEGEFEQATWPLWRSDLASTNAWCQANGLELQGLVATRLGAALACDAATQGDLPALRRTVLWQPVFDGARFLTQFLRLRLSASLAGATARESLADLRARLQSGAMIEVAGYSLSSSLALSLEQLRAPLALPDRWGKTLWMELRRSEVAASNLPALASAADLRVMPGDWFWSTTEITTVPRLIQDTVDFLVTS